MAHPKRKISKARRDKRRTHKKIAAPHINPPHQAVWEGEKLYYKNELIVNKKPASTT